MLPILPLLLLFFGPIALGQQTVRMMSKEMMLKHGIIFKKMPRDITRF